MAKKTVETTNTTTQITPLTMNRTWVDYIKNDTFLFFPEKDEWRQRFIYTLLSWAEREDSLEVNEFIFLMKIRRALLFEWCEKYQDIKQAYDLAKLMIGTRRKKGALNRKFDKDVVRWDIHKYDPEWLEINKYHSDMKKDEEKQSHTFNVNLGKPAVGTKEELHRKIEVEL